MATRMHSDRVDGTAGIRLLRTFHWCLVAGSVVLLLVTLISFPLAGHGRISRLLFQLGFAGENNVGAWWSGMLLFLAALQAFDGNRRDELPASATRGWLILALILMMLSFDEVSSLHEWVANTLGTIFWIPLGLGGAAMLACSLGSLWRAGVAKSHIFMILVAFALFGSVVIQEHIQHALNWDNPLAYGVRAFVEEGTEIAAMLLLLHVTAFNTRNVLDAHAGGAFGLARNYSGAATILALLLVPVLVAASFVLPYPGGPADWLASAVFMLAACSVFGEILARRAAAEMRTWLLLAVLVFASMLANAAELGYEISLGGVTVGIRGLGFSLLLPVLWWLFDRHGLRFNAAVMIVLSAVSMFLACSWRTQLVWVTVPALIAIHAYAGATRIRVATGASLPADAVPAFE